MCIRDSDYGDYRCTGVGPVGLGWVRIDEMDPRTTLMCIRTKQLPFAGVVVFSQFRLGDALGRHIHLVGAVSERLVDNLADLLVERKPRDVYRAVGFGEFEQRPPGTRPVAVDPDRQRLWRLVRERQSPGAVDIAIQITSPQTNLRRARRKGPIGYKFTPKTALPLLRSPPKCNTPIISPTPLAIPNGIQIRSAVLPQYTLRTHTHTDTNTDGPGECSVP